jgi:hypothetical protein
VVSAVVVIGLAWALAFSGYTVARQLKTTPAKVSAFLKDTDFAHLTGAARRKALKRLVAMLNALTLEQRQQARLEGELNRWLAAMTDEEKGGFIEATLPVGFQQMLSAFEQLPEAKRRDAIANALKNIRDAREREATNQPPDLASDDLQQRPTLSPELQEKAVKVGLQTFYDTSSATLKTELAPVLEALQESMNSGRLFRQSRFGREPGP